jgi:hypothetical protein
LTRKRLWRDSTGTIVAKKRPEHEKKRKRSTVSEGELSTTSQPRSHQTSRQHPPAHHANNIFPFPNSIPISPPGSSDPASNVSEHADPFGSEVVGSSENGQPSTFVDDEQWPIPNGNDNLPFQDIPDDSYDFLCNASWGSQPFPTDMPADLPFDDLFAPDTGECSLDSGNIDLLNSIKRALSICLSQP